MAIFHSHAQVLSRSNGRSAVAAAAYRAGELIVDERLGIVHDYSDKPHVLHSEIMLPPGAPEAFRDRGTLWNAVEAAEKRVNSQVARELEISLPRELPHREQIRLARDYVQGQFVSRGMCADWSLHSPLDKNGEAQPHVHIMLATREVRPDGFTTKQRAWNNPALVTEWREAFADLANARLAENGFDIRLDHRSFKDQGIDAQPSEKIGPAAARREQSERVETNKEIARENGEYIIRDPSWLLDVITQQRSTFTQYEMQGFVRRYTADTAQYDLALAAVEASPKLRLVGEDDNGRLRYSSVDLMNLETRMMWNAADLAQRERHVIPSPLLNRAVSNAAARGLVLGDDQREAARHMTAAGDLKLAVGIAGGGKSTTLAVTRDAWAQRGYRVIGAAPSGKAAKGLQSGSGIPSTTLAVLQMRLDGGREKLTARDVIVLDEAGMVPSRDMERIVTAAKDSGAKLVLIGDAAQLQPIAAGSSFKSLVERHGAAEINEVRRQREPWMRDATRELQAGKVEAALDRYSAADMVHMLPTKEAARNAMMEAWNEARFANPGATIAVFAHERVDVRAMNDAGRAMVRASGELGDDVQVQTELGARMFATGDAMVFLKNDRSMGISNGSTGRVTAVDERTMTVRLDDGGRVVPVDLERYDQVDHGYALTLHKGQGVTVDRAFMLGSSGLDRHLAYVGMSRHRERADLFIGRTSFIDDRHMLRTLSRDRSKDTTADYRTTAGQQRAFAERRGLDPDGPVVRAVRTVSAQVVSMTRGAMARAHQVAQAVVQAAREMADRAREQRRTVETPGMGATQTHSDQVREGVIAHKARQAAAKAPTQADRDRARERGVWAGVEKAGRDAKEKDVQAAAAAYRDKLIAASPGLSQADAERMRRVQAERQSRGQSMGR